MNNIITGLEKFALPILGSLIGSTLRISQKRKKVKEKIKGYELVYELSMSAALAFLTITLCDYLGYDSRVSGGIGLISAYAGIAIIDAVKDAFLDKIKNQINNK